MAPLRPIFVLLIAVFIVMAGTGALTTIVSVRLDAAGTPSLLLGAVSAAYYAGLTVGSVQAFRLVGRVGHIRAFSALAALLSGAVLGHVFGTDSLVWGVLRLIEGCCMAGLFVCIESWLNQGATSTTRGQVLALYMIATYAARGAGQYLLVIPDPHGFVQFVLVSALVSFALVPVALTRQAPPLLSKVVSFGVARLYRTSPLGFVGTVMSGLVAGAFYGLGPVYLLRLGYDLSDSAAFMSACGLGGVLLQWPLGKLSDLFDRRLVLNGLFAALLMVSLGMTAAAALGLPALLGGAVLFGGVMFALYPIAVAHTNDFLDPADMVSASGGMVLGFSVGATIGPFLAAAAMAAFEESGLFLFSAAVGMAALLFGLWRMTVRPSMPPGPARCSEGE
jgi:MFS family permease